MLPVTLALKFETNGGAHLPALRETLVQDFHDQMPATLRCRSEMKSLITLESSLDRDIYSRPGLQIHSSCAMPKRACTCRDDEHPSLGVDVNLSARHDLHVDKEHAASY